MSDSYTELEFIDLSGKILHTSSVPMDMPEVRELLDVFTFPFAVKVSAVRMKRDGRRVTVRRPRAAVVVLNKLTAR